MNSPHGGEARSLEVPHGVPETDLPVTIRPSTMADLPAVHKMLVPLMTARRLLPRTPEELEKLLPTGFVAEVEGEIIGFAAVEMYSKKLAEIQSLGVALPWRGRGLGKTLVIRCVELAREQGVYELMAITASEHLFLDCGFDFSLPDQKKALFIQLYDKHEQHATSTQQSQQPTSPLTTAGTEGQDDSDDEPRSAPAK